MLPLRKDGVFRPITGCSNENESSVSSDAAPHSNTGPGSNVGARVQRIRWHGNNSDVFRTQQHDGYDGVHGLLWQGELREQPAACGPVDTSVTGFTIMDGGSNYANPTLAIADFYGMTPTVITCSATLSGGMIIGVAACTASTNDFMAPLVNITDT